MFPIRRPANGINNFMHSVRSVLCVNSPATAQAQLLHSADGAAASSILNIHVTRSLSKQLAAADGNLQPPPASRPTFGVASGGEDGARRAEDVREIAGKTFHLLLRCLPTAEERCVAGSASALPPRQPSQRGEPGRAGGERGSPSAAPRRGAMTASLEAGGRAGGRRAPVEVGAARGAVSVRLSLLPLLLLLLSVSLARRGYLFE